MARRARASRKDQKLRQTSSARSKKEDGPVDTEPAVPKGQAEKAGSAPVKKGQGFKDWFTANRTTVILLLSIFVMAFLLREYLYYQISFDSWPPDIVGNDPSYHKRVIDWVQDENHHITIDHLLNYPLGGGNPRPPIFDWSIAIVGLVLSPLFGFNVAQSTWYVYQFAPTFWGALTIFPVYLLGKEAFGRKAGIMAAFLLAITASHIERSTLGFTDHDSFVVFFVVLSLYFLSKSFSVQKERDYVSDWRKPDRVLLGFRSFFRENREAVGYAFLTGIAIATIALTWEGFAYVLAILLIYYVVQLLLHRFRNEDSMGTFLLLYIVMATVVLISLPYYYRFSISTWSQGFYILLAMTAIGIFIVPTRDIPWLIVLPTMALLITGSYFIMKYSFPDTADMLFTGGGYFVKSKLYSTIAEAQAPDISTVIFTFGPATFFLGLIGVVWAVIRIPRHMKKDYIFIVIWTGVAIYMALSAIRFNFNATPAFAVLAGWVLVEIVRFFKATALSVFYSLIAVSIMLVGLGIVYEGWTGFFVKYYILITVLSTVLVSLGIFGYMKYRKNRESFKFRKVLTGLAVGFIVIMPNVFFAVDAAIPIESKGEYDPDLEYLGSFGSSLHSEYWMDSYLWLAEQDTMKGENYTRPEDRPGFMSWWDYGFDEILLGKHPTAADNFQNGYQFTGSMIACQNETEAIALMTARLIEGDFVGNKGKFSADVWDVLVSHLGDERNSTKGAYEILRIYKNPGSYIDRVEDNPDAYGNFIGLTAPNAKYAAARWVFTNLGEEGVVDLYHDVRECTGTSLRYFAVDYRLFPFSSSNTGIFYAPIKLADRDIDDYLEYRVYAQENTRGSNDDPLWTDYDDNPISMEKAKEESERLGYKFRIRNYEMLYTEDFYNSMFYRTYVGYSPSDVGATDDGQSVPGMFGDVQNMPAMQGWNMTHWKLVYRTMYYSTKDEGNASYPEDYVPMGSKEAIELYQEQGGDLKSGLGQGVFYLKYYDGAIVEGRVKTERGIGAPGIRVTVLDDYGIPHGSVITDEDGRYSLIAPPGTATFVTSIGELSNQYDRMYQFQIDQNTGQPSKALNITEIEISDELAMREVDEGRMTKDFVISGRTISGKVYWDRNDDSQYNEDDDGLVTRGEISFVHRDSEDLVYGPVELDGEGSYTVEDLVPGDYDVVYSFDEREEVLVRDYNVDPAETADKDVRIQGTSVRGHVMFEGGMPAYNKTLVLTSEGGETWEVPTDAAGNYSIEEVFPGRYSLLFDEPTLYHDEVDFIIEQGDDLEFNITLFMGSDLSLKVIYPYVQGSAFNGPVTGGVVQVSSVYERKEQWRAVLDNKGEVEMHLPAGEFYLYIHTMERDNYWSYLSNVTLAWRGTTDLDVVLENAFRVNGSITKLVDTPMNNTEVTFTRTSDKAVAFTYANTGGEYSLILPRAGYRVVVNNISSGNVTYINIQDIEAPMAGVQLDLDIWASQAIKVSGRVYWDKDQNFRFTDSETVSKYTGEDTIAEEIGLGGVDVRFTYSNGTLNTTTDGQGLYTIMLPPATYEMAVMPDGYDPFLRDVIVPDTVESRNFGVNGTDAMMVSQMRKLVLNVFYNYYGKDEITPVQIGETRIMVLEMEPYRGGRENYFVTDIDGRVQTEFLPGDLMVVLEEEYTSNGVVHTLRTEQQISFEPNSTDLVQDITVSHSVTFSSQLYLIENELVRYPSEVTVNLNPIQGTRATLDSVTTDLAGEFQFLELPAGDFILEAHQDRTAAHYLYWDMISIDEDLAPSLLEMKESYAVDGTVDPVFEDVEDSEVFLEMGGLWTSAGIDEEGRFSTFLYEGVYGVNYTFETVDEDLEGARVVYSHTSELTVDGAVFGLDLDLSKTLEISGAVYYDADDDRTVKTEEKQPYVNVTFTPEDPDLEPVTVNSGFTGDYNAMVPYTKLHVTVEAEGYLDTPREDLSVFDIPVEGVNLWDVPLVPKDIPVQGYMYGDRDGDSEFDDDEPVYPGIDLTFTGPDGEDHFASVDDDGRFSLSLPPGSYSVFGMRYVSGTPDAGYLSELTVRIGDDLTGLEWKAVGANRFHGTVFYKDTDGAVHFELPEEGTIEFVMDDGGTIETTCKEGSFFVDLPYYSYYASSSFEVQEYGQDITYKLNSDITVNASTTADKMAMEFKKSKDYSFKVDLLNDDEHEIEMAADETIRLSYVIENVGNEPITVDITVSEKPDSWIVELPEGTGIELGIGERTERQVNITSPKEPDWLNDIKFQGESTKGSKNTFQVEVKTPPSYRFDLKFDVPSFLGVGYDETRVFNLTVENMGSGEDVVNVRILPDITKLEEWIVEWEGEQDIPETGENISLTPREVRNVAITVKTPSGGDDMNYRDQLTLTFVGKNRLGDTVTRTITLKTEEPNLVLPSGFLKLTNRRLDDPVMNGTIEANITVRSLNRDAGNVNVSLKIDGLEVASGVIFYIPQGGTASTRVSFNITNVNVSKDDFHTFEVVVDPYNTVTETDDFDNVGIWYNVVVGDTPSDQVEINWRIVIFACVVILVALGIIAYKQRTEPI